MAIGIGRRKFLAAISSIAVGRPFASHAQQGERMRRIGVLLNLAEDDPVTRVRLAAFLDGLKEAGWIEGRNLKIDYRWGMGDLERHRINAEELVALAPDVILAHGSTIMGPLQRATRTIPIVFVSVSDPIAGGFIASLARPSGNATGFTSTDYSMSGKWLELLKQIAPQITRVGAIRDPNQVSGGGQLGAIQAVAPLLGVEISPLGVRDADEIGRAVADFARQPNGGLIVTTSALAQIHRELIIAQAAKHRLPAVYPYRLFVTSGGLMSYGPDIVDQYRRAAGYVDRILRSEKPADLPVQQPSKFDLVINLKTAKALGIEVPPTLLARAEETIE
jgi:putative tryptophan/tyrosine transport system substrate-binding protein